MKFHPAVSPFLAFALAGSFLLTAPSYPEEPQPARPLRDLTKAYFPFTQVKDAQAWETRREEVRRRVLVAAGLWPMPEKTPLRAMIHGLIDMDDYTVQKVAFQSLPGHFVTGSLYLPKKPAGKMPGILCPHGHWPNGRFMDAQATSAQQLATGAEKFTSGARSPLQARCVQLARMGCAAFLYDMLGVADSVQMPEHRHGPAEKGFVSAEAELNLEGFFPLQTWNSARALDFLLSLPGIDPTRIGCTGASGGGTQTLMITGIDDRITASFPCVMTSTAMQGGCTCENSNYLRINQGNIDIAALTVPRPLGMTAAKDWTQELETKGFPDLKALYAMVGAPDNVEAHFNLQFPHNYNAVSRAQMYAFFNKHFKLGLSSTDERDFRFQSPKELTVWDGAHPVPEGDNVGVAHELAVMQWFQHQAARQIDPLLHPENREDVKKAREIIGGALEVMIGRKLPQRGESVFTLGTRDGKEDKDDRGDYFVLHGVTHCGGDAVESAFLYPKKWNHDVALVLTLKGEAAILDQNGIPTEQSRKLLDEGVAIACPKLYMLGAAKNPDVYAARNLAGFEGYAGFHYGYNPSLFAERVRDALTMIAMIRDNERHHTERIIVHGLDGAGIIAAAATALARDAVSELHVRTDGFRFAKLTDVWDADFLPGAVKYGDVTGVLSLCAPVKMTLQDPDPALRDAVAQTYRATGAAGNFTTADAAK
jgi:dienelactone hydrolase